MRCPTLWLSLFATLFVGLQPARADVPTALEPDYAEAVLAFNSRNYAQTLKVLETLLQRSPEVPEFLELQALVYKATDREQDSARTYEILIEKKGPSAKSPKELAPYHFELGLIRYREKKATDAEKHLRFALEQEFNTGATHLYLGMMSFQAGKWSDADDHFQGVVSNGGQELRPIGYFYLGQVSSKTGYSAGATQNFILARSAAESVLDSPSASPTAKTAAQQILDATEKALKPYDHGRFFGSIALTAGIDSNTLAIPSSVTSETETSRKASGKTTLSVGAGYSTSPMNLTQFLTSYRGNLSYLTNTLARPAEFHDHMLSLYLTRNPMARFSYGLKGEGSLVFKNDVQAPISRSSFSLKLYSESLSVGPFIKYQLKPKLILMTEALVQPQKYDQDGPGDLARSGIDYQLRTFLKSETGERFWNPVIGLRLDRNQTKGTDFRSNGLGIDFSNQILVDRLTEANLGATVGLTAYPAKTGEKRNDKQLILRASAARKLGSGWSVNANTDYTLNSSTIDASYSYKRLTASGGITYSF